MKKQNSLPESLLQQINEQTAGGFIIFFVNSKGRPDWLGRIDNETLHRGLISYIEDTVESIRSIDKDNRINTLIDNDDDDS